PLEVATLITLASRAPSLVRLPFPPPEGAAGPREGGGEALLPCIRTGSSSCRGGGTGSGGRRRSLRWRALRVLAVPSAVRAAVGRRRCLVAAGCSGGSAGDRISGPFRLLCIPSPVWIQRVRAARSGP
uniref:Uncharacterized protein n=2 Tax=Aegilops tauschii subsp. strangulata TaxID=200361 RepID=A0A453JKA6_AEGTS